MNHVFIEFLCLFLTGIMAGEEFVVRYGVRAPLATLTAKAHIQMRQALILKLRILVPAIYLPTLVSAIAVLTLDGSQPGFGFRLAGVLLLLTWILITLTGTGPINAATLEWKPNDPPEGWKTLVDTWDGLNTLRTVAAVLAFISLLAGVALRLS
jgi:hypothetical protein